MFEKSNVKHGKDNESTGSVGSFQSRMEEARVSSRMQQSGKSERQVKGPYDERQEKNPGQVDCRICGGLFSPGMLLLL